MLTHDRKQPLRWFAWIFLPLVILLPAIIGGYVNGWKPSLGFTGMKIAADPFVWPKGCMPALYNIGDAIPRACAAKSNEMPNADDYGLPAYNGSKGKRWYRLGNDAFVIFCGFGWGDCSVYSKVPGKFVTQRSSAIDKSASEDLFKRQVLERRVNPAKD